MEPWVECMEEYRRQMTLGLVPKAYQGLMQYLLSLKTHLKDRHPDFFVSGTLYFGYMDMTYFSFYPPALGQKKLKVAIVFVHPTMRFEAWLAGYNKQVQLHYWQRFRDGGWNLYPLVPALQGSDAIVEHVLVEQPNFGDLPALTGQVERGTLKFIADLEQFLGGAEPGEGTR